MKKSNQIIILTTLILGIAILTARGQESAITDSSLIKETEYPLISAKEKKVRKNSIMITVSNPALISTKFQTIGYERILPNNQSFTVNVGIFSIPEFRGNLADSLGLNTDYKDKGFHFSTDYRFYLKKENKYAAPRGVYLAPYYTYNRLSRENSWNFENEGVVEKVYTDLTLNIHTIGAELGYQFIFWDRVALDLILIGPGFGFYNLKAEVGTNMDPIKESEFFDKLNQILADKIPGYDKVIGAGDFSKKGTYNTEGVGFRYLIRVGYRF